MEERKEEKRRATQSVTWSAERRSLGPRILSH